MTWCTRLWAVVGTLVVISFSAASAKAAIQSSLDPWVLSQLHYQDRSNELGAEHALGKKKTRQVASQTLASSHRNQRALRSRPAASAGQRNNSATPLIGKANAARRRTTAHSTSSSQNSRNFGSSLNATATTGPIGNTTRTMELPALVNQMMNQASDPPLFTS